MHEVHGQKSARVVDYDCVHPIPGQSHGVWFEKLKLLFAARPDDRRGSPIEDGQGCS